MIKPTLGRIVWFHEAGSMMPAMVCSVHDDRLVNLSVCGPSGFWYGAIQIPLLQDDDKPPESGTYAEWMPYQKVQAAKEPMKENAGGSLNKL